MTGANHGSGFAGECRRFLRHLPDLCASGSTPGATGTGAVIETAEDHRQGREAALRHVANCSRCAGHLAAARTQLDLLRRVPVPQQPAELAPQMFLSMVHERVVDRSALACDRLLGDLRPLRAPADTVWQEGEAPAPTISGALGSLRQPAPQAPAWVWQRIRAEVARQRRADPGPVLATARTRWRAGLLAATLLVCGTLAAVLHGGFESDGTRASTSIVWYIADHPPSEAASPTGILRQLGR